MDQELEGGPKGWMMRWRIGWEMGKVGTNCDSPPQNKMKGKNQELAKHPWAMDIVKGSRHNAGGKVGTNPDSSPQNRMKGKNQELAKHPWAMDIVKGSRHNAGGGG